MPAKPSDHNIILRPDLCKSLPSGPWQTTGVGCLGAMSSPTPSGPPPGTPRRDDGRGKLTEVFTSDDEQENPHCRFCWALEDGAALLSPCLCTGGWKHRARCRAPHRPTPLLRRRRTGRRRWRPAAAGSRLHHVLASDCTVHLHAPSLVWPACMSCSTSAISMLACALFSGTSGTCRLLSVSTQSCAPVPAFVSPQAPRSMCT